MPPLDVASHAKTLETQSAADVLRWTWDTFGLDAAATSSFQTHSLPLLHLIATTVPELPVLFLDTGFHFPETLRFRDRVVEELGLNLHVLKTRMGHERFQEKHGQLHRRDPDLCCHLNKVKPLQRAMADRMAWVAGIRRDQTAQRQDTPVLAGPESVDRYDVYKICPIASWTEAQVQRYRTEHDLPEHPLGDQGYASIGCAPCTQPVTSGDSRAGRWANHTKTECGLHFDTDPEESA